MGKKLNRFRKKSIQNLVQVTTFRFWFIFLSFPIKLHFWIKLQQMAGLNPNPSLTPTHSPHPVHKMQTIQGTDQNWFWFSRDIFHWWNRSIKGPLADKRDLTTFCNMLTNTLLKSIKIAIFTVIQREFISVWCTVAYLLNLWLFRAKISWMLPWQPCYWEIPYL